MVFTALQYPNSYPSSSYSETTTIKNHLWVEWLVVFFEKLYCILLTCEVKGLMSMCRGILICNWKDQLADSSKCFTVSLNDDTFKTTFSRIWQLWGWISPPNFCQWEILIVWYHLNFLLSPIASLCVMSLGYWMAVEYFSMTVLCVV